MDTTSTCSPACQAYAKCLSGKCLADMVRARNELYASLQCLVTADGVHVAALDSNDSTASLKIVHRDSLKQSSTLHPVLFATPSCEMLMGNVLPSETLVDLYIDVSRQETPDAKTEAMRKVLQEGMPYFKKLLQSPRPHTGIVLLTLRNDELACINARQVSSDDGQVYVSGNLEQDFPFRRLSDAELDIVYDGSSMSVTPEKKEVWQSLLRDSGFPTNACFQSATHPGGITLSLLETPLQALVHDSTSKSVRLTDGSQVPERQRLWKLMSASSIAPFPSYTNATDAYIESTKALMGTLLRVGKAVQALGGEAAGNASALPPQAQASTTDLLPTNSPRDLSTGAIAGIVVACVVAVAMLGYGTYRYRKHQE